VAHDVHSFPSSYFNFTVHHSFSCLFLKEKNAKKTPCLSMIVVNAGRERDRMVGTAPEAGADIQDRRHCVGRVDI
jgi:hypothetical protein